MHRFVLPLLLLVSLVFVLNGCSKNSDKEYWDEAVKYQKENKIDKAVSSYEQLVKDHPESPLAPKALLEAAKIYQGGNVKNVSSEESARKAIEYYKRIYTEYSNSSEAPSSLFMVGFIQSNELRNFDEATSAYKLFLSKYPNHEMAPSAKVELDNMGLSPEEIINKRSAKQ